MFHVAEAGAWPAISRLGLLSASAVLDRFGVNGRLRQALEAAPRPDSVRLRHPFLGEVWIRDNKPLRPEILATCLEGISVAEWMRLLNGRVFFWLDRDRARRLVHARAQRNRGHDLLVLDTRSVIERHREAIELAAINTGATLFPGAPRRGRGTFMTLNDYEPGRRVVELTIAYAVADVEDLTIRVEPWQAGQPAEVLWQRPGPGRWRTLD